MKRIKKKYSLTRLSLWILGLATLALLSSTKAQAAATAVVDIHVSISANKSVSLAASSTYYAFGAMPLSSAIVSGSSITVTNDSGAYVETYRLSGAAAISDTGGQNWAIANATGTNTYALGAMFSDTKPADTQAVWPSAATSAELYLTGSAVTCTGTQFGDGSAGDEGAGVSPIPGVRDRWLWFRMYTPAFSTGTEGRTAQVTISIL